MSDLVEFLLARIGEDEEGARSAAPGPWSYGDIASVAGGSLYDPDVMIAGVHWDPPSERVDPRIRRTRPSSEADNTGKHIARHDPARVLAECEAKRRIVSLHHSAGSYLLEGSVREYYCATCGSGEPYEYPTRWPCFTLRLLTLPYADHPAYREEWRP